MTDERATAAWSLAVGAEPDEMDRGELGELLTAVRLARSRLDAVEVRAARRLRSLAAIGQSECAEAAIASSTDRSARDALDVAARDALCDAQPGIEDALVEGSLSAAHLDAINAAGRRLPDEVLAEFRAHGDILTDRAARVSLDTFRRECHALAKKLLVQSRSASDVDELAAQRAASKVTRWVDSTTGMHNTLLELDPVRDATLNASINRCLARRRAITASSDVSWQEMLVDAALDAVAGIRLSRADDADRSGGDNGRTVTDQHPDSAGPPITTIDRVPEITMVLHYDTLVAGGEAQGVLPETENGTPIPADTARRACCDSEIIPVVLGGDSCVLDLGRSRRTASREQRRALRSVHRGCAHPQCHVGFDSCRVHHVRHWLEHRGPTDLHNLLPLCERHHHLVHEGGWSVDLDSDRVATWRRPDGVVHHRGQTVDRGR
jgi:hypothetical protein